MMFNGILVAVGSFFGACARYGVNLRFKRLPSTFPWATLSVNLSGSFLIGLIMGAGWGDKVYLLLGTGFMGAYTTFSTFNVENIELVKNKEWKKLMLYTGSSYVFGILLAYAGYLLTFWLI